MPSIFCAPHGMCHTLDTPLLSGSLLQIDPPCNFKTQQTEWATGCLRYLVAWAIVVARRARGACSPHFSGHIVILCFERRYPKQNSVIRLKSNIPPTQFLSWLRYWPECIRLRWTNQSENTYFRFYLSTCPRQYYCIVLSNVSTPTRKTLDF